MSQENQTKTFQIGDTVTWTSQAGGNAKTKTGEIVAVVPAACEPRNCINGRWNFRRIAVGFRKHESYLIQVGDDKRLYWPLVKYLEKIHDGPQLQEEFESLDIAERKDGSLKWIAAD